MTSGTDMHLAYSAVRDAHQSGIRRRLATLMDNSLSESNPEHSSSGYTRVVLRR
jgi:hypothetical protein